MKNGILLNVLMSFMLFSCKKEKISKTHPELAGRWTEQTGTDQYKILEINQDGSGVYYEDYPSEGDKKHRKWRLKDNFLFYGLTDNLGEITEYPTNASSDMPYGNNDTIIAGTRYFIPNNTFYTED
ncbi:MAG TPA: hypothetical protein VGC65_10500 [Bacteroidia bacterium]|jgi:hypothetical protein